MSENIHMPRKIDSVVQQRHPPDGCRIYMNVILCFRLVISVIVNLIRLGAIWYLRNEVYTAVIRESLVLFWNCEGPSELSMIADRQVGMVRNVETSEDMPRTMVSFAYWRQTNAHELRVVHLPLCQFADARARPRYRLNQTLLEVSTDAGHSLVSSNRLIELSIAQLSS